MRELSEFLETKPEGFSKPYREIISGCGKTE